MSRYSVSPELLFDRPWRVGHPFRPHCGKLRRWVMIVLLVGFCLIIGGYDYLTDGNRVREMAQSYLSRLVGGRVEVGKARLSIFEGLRLENVSVHVDESTGPADSVIFSAQTFILRYDPRSMLTGQLEATQIIAEKPRVFLTENLLDGSWNFNRLMKSRNQRKRPLSAPSGRATRLPQILLRNARVDMSEVRDGKLSTCGYMAIDGLILPSPDPEHYSFELQSRGGDGIGPYVNGTLNYNTGAVDAHLRNFEFGEQSEFGHEVLAMLPDTVRTWWQRHELAGRLDLPVLQYFPSHDPKGSPHFRVEADLNGVTLSVGPEEWGRAASKKDKADAPATPIQLRQVAGVLVFDEGGIEVSDATGRIENNAFRVTGRIGGYQPASPLQLRVSSLESENLYVPQSPRYVASLPPMMRALYENLKPQGLCRFDLEIDREQAGSRPEVRGALDVIDGQFAFKHFAYPLRNVTGRIVFGPDPRLGELVVHLIDLKGYGIAQGPNEQTLVTIGGTVGPFRRGSDPILDLTVASDHAVSEPVLMSVFPPEVQRALKLLGAKTGGMPRFDGGFVCHVSHPSPHARISFDTDLSLRDAAGALEGFAYPLEHVHGMAHVRDGYVDLDHVQARHRDAAITLDGRVAWGAEAERPAGAAPLQTRLKVVCSQIPLDGELLAALPPERQAWLSQLQLAGKLDINGTVWQPPLIAGAPAASPSAEQIIADLDYDLGITIHGGALSPKQSQYRLEQVEGDVRLTPRQLELAGVTGRRGSGTIKATGQITWPLNRPLFAVNADARNLELEPSLRELLPADAQAGWDALQPVGTVDAQVQYRSVGIAENASAMAQSAGSSAGVALVPHQPTASPYHLVLRPRKLSVTPRVLPYALAASDGLLTLDGNHVLFEHVLASHGDATVALDGTGELGSASSFDLRIAAKKLQIDPELIGALPSSVGGMLDALKIRGRCDVQFPRFSYRAAATQPAGPGEAQSPGESTGAVFDVTTNLALHDASLDVGIPLKQVNGEINLDLGVIDSRLDRVHGKLALSSLLMAGRPVTNFKAELLQSPQKGELQVARMRGTIGGGDLAGDLRLAFPDDGPSRYGLELIARGVDVRTLANEVNPDIRGELTASLSLEGVWGDAASRRGRGDVLVVGKEMYRIPLLLGLLQVTNLSLPIAEPFQRGSVRYSLDGQRVIFDHIELRNASMVMNGAGHLDYATRQVRLSFTTDNPGGLNVPFLRDLWQGARNELLTINVKGTIAEPKVETSVMGTLTTTVDEVLRGDEKR